MLDVVILHDMAFTYVNVTDTRDESDAHPKTESTHSEDYSHLTYSYLIPYKLIHISL